MGKIAFKQTFIKLNKTYLTQRKGALTPAAPPPPLESANELDTNLVLWYDFHDFYFVFNVFFLFYSSILLLIC